MSVNCIPRPLHSQEIDLVPIVREAGWAPGPVWMGAENLAPTGMLSPDGPACNELLYRLHYTDPLWCVKSNKKKGNITLFRDRIGHHLKIKVVRPSLPA